jgi:hypothetical protein
MGLSGHSNRSYEERCRKILPKTSDFISLEGVEEGRSMNDALGELSATLQRTAKESTGFKFNELMLYYGRDAA